MNRVPSYSRCILSCPRPLDTTNNPFCLLFLIQLISLECERVADDLCGDPLSRVLLHHRLKLIIVVRCRNNWRQLIHSRPKPVKKGLARGYKLIQAEPGRDLQLMG